MASANIRHAGRGVCRRGLAGYPLPIHIAMTVSYLLVFEMRACFANPNLKMRVHTSSAHTSAMAIVAEPGKIRTMLFAKSKSGQNMLFVPSVSLSQNV